MSSFRLLCLCFLITLTILSHTDAIFTPKEVIRILERFAKEEKQHKPNVMKRLGTTERKQYDKKRDKTKYDRNGNPIRPKKKHKPLLGPGRQSKDPLDDK